MKSFYIKYKSYFAILDLINRYFWKSIIGPLNCILMPLLLMVVYYVIGTQGNNNEIGLTIFVSNLPTFISFAVLPLCFITLPYMIGEFKQSIILRKISSSEVTSSKFCVVVAMFFIAASMFSILITFLMFLCFLNINTQGYLSSLNVISLIYSICNFVVVAFVFGLLLGIVIKRIIIIQMLGFLIMLVSVLLSGQLLPYDTVSSAVPLRILAMLSPVTHPMSLIQNISWNLAWISKYGDLIKQTNIGLYNQLVYGSDIFNLSYNFNVLLIKDDNDEINTKLMNIYFSWEKIIHLLMPYIYTSVLSFLSIKYFKWSAR